MNKHEGCPVCANIFALCFLFVFASLLTVQCVHASEPLMINGKSQMLSGETQSLSLMNYRTGLDYTWTLEGGSGTLSPDGGEKVSYTAPDSNADCAGNPTIGVTDSEGNYGQIRISINSYPGRAVAYKYGRECGCAVYNPATGHFNWGCGAKAYGCNGEYLGLTSPSASCRSSQPYGCGQCPQFCDACGKEDELVDVRTDLMKASGCCPETAQPWFEPKPSVPADIDFGRDPQANDPVCDPSLKGNPIRIYNGNNLELERDIRLASPNRRQLRFWRFYNSRSKQVGPLGYGWTHSYSAYLETEYEYKGEMFLRIVDESGRGVYFRDQGNGRYTGSFKERSHVAVEDEDYIWYRYDGSRFAFEASGRLIWIEDEVGNRQLVTYDSSDRLQNITDEASGRTLSFTYNEAGLLDHISGPVCSSIPSGILASYGYDESQNLTSVTYADGSGFKYAYASGDDPHNLTEKRDNMGHILSTWTYDNQDRATESFTRDGRGVSIDYRDDNEVKVTDPYGITSTYWIWQVDGRKRVTDIEKPQGCHGCGGGDIIRLEYDSALRVIEVEYANGLIEQYEDFDDQGNAHVIRKAPGTKDETIILSSFHPEIRAKLSQSEPSILGTGDKTTIWDYDDDGNDIPNENPTKLPHRKIERGFTRDISGNIIPYEYITSYTYDSKGNILSVDGPQPGTADTTTFAYDTVTGDLLSITRPVVGTTTYSQYSADGRVGRITDPNGNATLYTYDGRGRVLSVTQEGNGTTTYTYNAAGDIATIIQPNGVTTRFTYDAVYGRLVRIEDTLGNSTRLAYDDQGNRIELSRYNTDGLLVFRKRFDYQAPGNPGKLWKEINPDDTFIEYAYDPSGNVAAMTDPSGKTTSYGYDLLNRLISVTQPGDVTTTYTYDDHSNLAGVTDAENHTTTYVHDDLGRLEAVTSPDTGTTVYAYDPADNLIARRDANGNTISYAYDELNRLIAIHFPDPSQDITYTYDAGVNGKGKLTGMADSSGTYAYSYNSFHRLEKEEVTLDGITYSTSYAYDPSGLLSAITYPSGRVVTYERDSTGNLTRVTSTRDGETQTVADNITHLPFGPMTDMTYGNGIPITQAYDQLYRLTDLQAGSIEDLSYSRDPAGNITTIADHLDPTRDRYFTYDDLYRLTNASGIEGTFVYSYDKAGNRLSRTVNGMMEQYSYIGNTNRIQEITGANPVTFGYDANGNTTAMGARSLLYNQNNRLIQVAENGTPLGAYVYNGKGQRTKKTSHDGTVYFLYDKDGNLIAEADGQGSIIREYLYAEGRRIAMIQAEQPAQDITVTVSSSKNGPLSDIRVYAFTAAGSYTGRYADTDEHGTAVFPLENFSDGSYKFRADYLGCHFWSQDIPVPATLSAQVVIEEQTAETVVTVAGAPEPGVRVYLFSEGGSYLGLYSTTDVDGKVSFDLPAGHVFKFRADYLSNHYWSDPILITPGQTTTLTVAAGGGILTITAENQTGTPLVGLRLYLFSPSGAYLGSSGTSDENGQVSYRVSSGSFKVRADYLGYHFWTDVIPVDGDTAYSLIIPEGLAEVTVTNMGLPLQGIHVYVFTPGGSYLGIHGETNTEGVAVFTLAEGEFTFRADYLGNQYWSGNTTIIPQVSNPVTISTGGGVFTLTVLEDQSIPLENVPCYLFTDSGAYLGKKEVTNSQGEANFNLADGTYKTRIDYLGYQFWTEPFPVPETSSMTKTIPHQNVMVTVNGDYNGDVLPFPNLKVYLFAPSGAYLNRSSTTDAGGSVTFSLPEQEYKVRADYLHAHYWSDPFTWEDTTINIHEGMAEVRTTQGQNPLANVNVYVFSASNAYLGIHGKTDVQGIVSFRLPEGTYNFRADYQGSHYWATASMQADQVNQVDLDTGGGSVTLTVEKAQGDPLVNIPIYVFTSNGAYLGMTAHSDNQGLASFDLSDGSYKFRVDYMGYHFWTDPFEVPQALSQVLTIPHQDVGVTVNKVYGDDSQPLGNTRVYLFTENSAYQGIHADTDAQGRVLFNVPQKSYKVRADYLRGHYWSDVFEWQDTEINIEHGKVNLHVTNNGSDLENVPVYLFSEQGAYLGKSERTDAYGAAVFTIPARSYKFRVDYNGTQYWSDVINVIPNEETGVSLALEQLALDLTNNPNPVRFDGKPPVFKPSKIRVASIGSLAGILLQGIVAQISEEKIYYFINDHLGTPRKVVDENGRVVWSADYQPFGQAALSTETVTNNFRFPGQYYDAETGLHYNYHRSYNPSTGRYLNPDPIGLAGGLNLFAYVQNNPINSGDPNGMVGIGGGAYYVAGAEASFTNSTCCENGNLYKVKILTICGGLGLGIRGATPIGAKIASVSSRVGCPQTRYYFKHEIVFLYRSVNVQGDIHGPSANIDVGIYGISAAWVFCSDTVISKTKVGCCYN